MRQRRLLIRVQTDLIIGVCLACAVGACGRAATKHDEVATEPGHRLTDAGADTPEPVDARTTRFGVGDTVSIERQNAFYEARQAIGDSDCFPWRDEQAEPGDSPRDFDLGTVVAVTTACPGGEMDLVEVNGFRSPVYADALSAAPRACLDAVVAMQQIVFPALDACRGRAPKRYRGVAGTATLLVYFDDTGTAADVKYHGTTAWGPKAATCMIEATKRAHLDGSDCPHLTVRLAKSY